MVENFPHFLIAGAAKCGTSTLYSILAQHPRICVSSISEPGFFAGDNPKTQTIQQYRTKYFSPLPGQLCGEASTNNLYVPAACESIRVSAPNAKIIILVRRPWDAIFSWYHQVCRYRNNLPEFQHLARSQIKERRIVDKAPSRILFDLDRYSYVPQIERFVEAFGRDRVCVVSFHDLITRAQVVVGQVTEFLRVDSLEVPQKPHVVNPHMEAGNRGARVLLQFLNGIPDSKLLQTLIPLSLRTQVRCLLSAVVWRPTPKPPFPEQILPALKEYYAADVEVLANDFGVVLTDDQ